MPFGGIAFGKTTEVGVEGSGRQDFCAKHSDNAPPEGLP